MIQYHKTRGRAAMTMIFDRYSDAFGIGTVAGCVLLLILICFIVIPLLKQRNETWSTRIVRLFFGVIIMVVVTVSSIGTGMDIYRWQSVSRGHYEVVEGEVEILSVTSIFSRVESKNYYLCCFTVDGVEFSEDNRTEYTAQQIENIKRASTLRVSYLLVDGEPYPFKIEVLSSDLLS